MELNEAGRRILGQHWPLILLAVLWGAAVGALLHYGDDKTYTASTRLVLDAPDPATRQASAAIADAAKAIATSPAQVRRALNEARATGRDPDEFAKENVSVRALGTSAVMQLSVSDSDPRAAAAVSNALAAGLIRTRLEVGRGGVQQILTTLDRRIAALNRQILAIDSDLAPRSSRGRARVRESLVRRRGVLESERDDLISADAVRPKPSIISAARPPAEADSSRLLPDMILGGLLALLMGVGLAGLLETFRPTVVGGDALARELDAPLLGHLPGDPDKAISEVASIGLRMRLAAEVKEVRNVGLLGLGPPVDLRALAERLNKAPAETEPMFAEVLASSGSGSGAGARVSPFIEVGVPNPRMPGAEGESSSRAGARPELWIRPFDPERATLRNGGASSLVLVMPDALKKAELADARHFLTATHLPLLGVITYKPRSRRRVARQTRRAETGPERS